MPNTDEITSRSKQTRFKPQLTISVKMLVGYIPLVVFAIVMSIYVLWGLNTVNDINRRIIENDTSIISFAGMLVDDLLGQESYGQKFVIMGSEEMKGLFLQRSQDFRTVLYQMGNTSPDDRDLLQIIRSLHDEYLDFYEDYFKMDPKSQGLANEAYDSRIKTVVDQILKSIDRLSRSVEQRRSANLLRIGEISQQMFRVISVMTCVGIIIGMGAAFIITRDVSGAITKLTKATDLISEGKFDPALPLERNDELGDLARAFGEMAHRLSRWEEMYLDASPLTRLPGGVAIDNVLKKRLDAGKAISFCLLDIDNFKSYNDKYGYSRGNTVIQNTARIIETTVARLGNGDDFIGHIGGDDFVVITTPDKYSDLIQEILDDFDKAIPGLYDEDDRATGYIRGKTRQGEPVNFPTMTLSVAVVSNDKVNITNYLDVGEIVAELKDHAKLIPGSKMVTNRRASDEKNV
ncbi:MAG: diguanylate cyclase [Proteobacteria bacterium]|nr:diguanylate cyclase [Pseudomonadota bacterium]